MKYYKYNEFDVNIIFGEKYCCFQKGIIDIGFYKNSEHHSLKYPSFTHFLFRKPFNDYAIGGKFITEMCFTNKTWRKYCKLLIFK